MAKVCETPDCDRPLPPHKGRQRPRKFCEVCRPPRNRPNPRAIQLAVADTPPVPADPPLVASCRKRLAAAGREADPLGAQALLLAEMLAAGGHTAAGAASLSRELRAAMDAALAGAPAEPDALDELARRRDRKLSGA